MISIVACCHGAKLCAHAARDFRSQQQELRQQNTDVCVDRSAKTVLHTDHLFFLLDLFRISETTGSAALGEGGMTSKSCISCSSLDSSSSEEENS